MKKMSKFLTASFITSIITASMTTSVFASTYLQEAPTSLKELLHEQHGMTEYQKLLANSQSNPLHKGEVPLTRIIDEKTGVIIETFDVIESAYSTYASGWQIIGYDYWNLLGDNNYYKTGKIVSSGGGDFGVRISPYSAKKVNGSPYIDVLLYEQDPTGDDYVASGTATGNWVAPKDIIFRNIGAWVDGSDGKAEFYTYYASNIVSNGSVYVEYID